MRSPFDNRVYAWGDSEVLRVGEKNCADLSQKLGSHIVHFPSNYAQYENGFSRLVEREMHNLRKLEDPLLVLDHFQNFGLLTIFRNPRCVA